MDPDEVGWIEFDTFQEWFASTDGKIQAVRSKAELWRRTTEQFQEAALLEQKEMVHRIRWMDKRLQEHVAEWAELMGLLKKKYVNGRWFSVIYVVRF